MPSQDPSSALSPRQLVALEALLTREYDENLESVAERSGIHVRTLHRYLADPDFDRAFRHRIRIEMGANRYRVSTSLLQGATRPGMGQAAMQKLFWQLVGDYKESVEITGKDGGAIQVESSPINMGAISVEGRKKILAVLEEERVLQIAQGKEQDREDGDTIDADYKLIEERAESTNQGATSYPSSHSSPLPTTFDPESED